ncbi:MAG: hypothetical protein KJZ77_03560 [Anaerolineales bacterium]|nr:hypothetical protein [Anaerolineales bacterium]
MDGETQAEKKRENSIKLPLGKKYHQKVEQFVIPGKALQRNLIWIKHRVVESGDVDDQDAKDGKPAQDIKNVDAFCLVDRAQ